jgi:hypothetical protein
VKSDLVYCPERPNPKPLFPIDVEDVKIAQLERDTQAPL